MADSAPAGASERVSRRMPPREPWVAAWLFAICVCVVAMILVGGATRLTDSGLSITEWRLDKGLTPPLTQARWDEEFALYQRTTEYREQNYGMSLADFQGIYWWEWGHRFLGKMIGVVFALPFLIFWATGRLKGRFWSALGLFALGGLQGGIGWWMVTSGLFSGLDVAPIRLAVHLGMAFLILALALWLALGALGWPRASSRMGAPGWAFGALIIVLFAQVLFGALLAGADAGKAYADWPTIGGEWLPSSYAALEPFSRNLSENHATQQFNHRTLGYVAGALALLLGGLALRSGLGPGRRWAIALGGVALLQVILGITAVVHAAPLGLSLVHQAVAIGLWMCAIVNLRCAQWR